MAVYTFSAEPRGVILCDDEETLVAVNSHSFGVLSEIFDFLQDPTNPDNLTGIKLRYLEKQKAWIYPDGSLALFYVGTNPDNFIEINSKIKKYSKIEPALKAIGRQWGFLTNDAGVALELQPYELIEVYYRPKRKCGTSFYLTSKLYPVLSVDNTQMTIEPTDVEFRRIINEAENLEEVVTSFGVDSISLNSRVYQYVAEIENIETTLGIENILLKRVILPQNIAEIENIETTFGVESIVYG